MNDAAKQIRRSRRHPRPTQFDYIHLRYLLSHLAAAIDRVVQPSSDVLDVFCGTRPYEELFPADTRYVGMDIEDPWGVADVVSDAFLPFESASFDIVLCVEAFQYVADPAHGAAEIRRVLRPRGWVILAVPLVWEYDRSILEHRFTGPELTHLFRDWDDVQLVENGAAPVAWATLTGRMIDALRHLVPDRLALRSIVSPGFGLAYLALNAFAWQMERAGRRLWSRSPYTLPMNLLLTARRPSES